MPIKDLYIKLKLWIRILLACCLARFRPVLSWFESLQLSNMSMKPRLSMSMLWKPEYARYIYDSFSYTIAEHELSEYDVYKFFYFVSSGF